MTRKTVWALTFSLLTMAAALSAQAAGPGIKLGILKCDQVPGSGVNLLIHSTAQVTCLFTSVTGERHP